jgi:ribosomal protein S18 acetylase RimI-like enzyme
LTVAKAGPDDFDTVAAILANVQAWMIRRGITLWATPFPDDWIDEKINAGEFHIASCQGVPVAVVRLLWADPLIWDDWDQGDAGYVHTMAVHRDHAGQGLGARLLDWAAAQVRSSGRQYLRLDCRADNPTLNTYYQRLGFSPQGVTGVGDMRVTLFEKELGA